MKTAAVVAAIGISTAFLVLGGADDSTKQKDQASADGASVCGALQQLVQADSRQSLKQARTAIAAELRKHYAGKISGQTRIGSKEAVEQSRRMSELMRLWNPIGFRVRDVKFVLGPPTHEWKRGERSSFTHYAGFQYDFDHGFGGSYWQFTAEGEAVEPDSTVAGIRHIPGE